MKYIVLQYFQWGQLKLEKGQHILIEAIDNKTSIVSVEHYPEKKVTIGPLAVESMVFLKKIKKY